MKKEVETKNHIIRLAEYSDIPSILDFIKKEWNSDHIYVKNALFFEYEHYIDGRVNGILAISRKTSNIDAIWLFYQTKRELKGADLFGGIWCVAKNCSVPMLGYKVVCSAKELTGARGHTGVGINPQTTVKIVRRMKDQYVGKMEHYYRIADKREYKVAVVEKKIIIPYKEEENCRLIGFNSIQQLTQNYVLPEYETTYPYKDEWYINKRYFNHPIYQYKVYGIKIRNRTEGILIARSVRQNGVRILRIVDFIGNYDAISNIGNEIQNLIEKDNYEYVDFYEYGIDDSIMSEAGFAKVSDENIIPNYFEPFVRKNIDLWFHSPYTNYTVFKADADQDRPNMVS